MAIRMERRSLSWPWRGSDRAYGADATGADITGAAKPKCSAERRASPWCLERTAPSANS
jgi:hypothetical protein